MWLPVVVSMWRHFSPSRHAEQSFGYNPLNSVEWQLHSLVVHLTGRTNSHFRVKAQFLLSLHSCFRRLRLHPPYYSLPQSQAAPPSIASLYCIGDGGSSSCHYPPRKQKSASTMNGNKRWNEKMRLMVTMFHDVIQCFDVFCHHKDDQLVSI